MVVKIPVTASNGKEERSMAGEAAGLFLRPTPCCLSGIDLEAGEAKESRCRLYAAVHFNTMTSLLPDDLKPCRLKGSRLNVCYIALWAVLCAELVRTRREARLLGRRAAVQGYLTDLSGTLTTSSRLALDRQKSSVPNLVAA